MQSVESTLVQSVESTPMQSVESTPMQSVESTSMQSVERKTPNNFFPNKKHTTFATDADLYQASTKNE